MPIMLSEIKNVCEQGGGVPTVAKQLGITRHAIYQWKEIPPKHLIAQIA